MDKIALITCSQTKKIGSHKAKDLYIGQVFKASRIVAEEYFDDYFILSAKYGLVEKDTIIDHYDEVLNSKSKKERILWAYLVFEEFKKKINNNKVSISIFGGTNYYEYLMPMLKKEGFKVDVFGRGLPYCLMRDAIRNYGQSQ